MRAAGWLCLLGLACGGCGRLAAQRPTLPAQYLVHSGQLVVHSDAELPPDHRLLHELVVLRNDLLTALQLPESQERVHVYLFDSAERFRTFMRLHYPYFPERRAFFVEGDTTLAVYAFWGDRVAEDLRHEVTHGYLHAVVPNIPLWLDEGLAEYYEVPRSAGGLHWPHVEELMRSLHAGWRPHLARLEQLTSAADMQQLDYAESWAWVHFLLHSTPQRRQLLHETLRDLHEHRTARLLSRALRERAPEPERALVEHVRRLAFPEGS